jgi:tetratricopeptide (TPR) repeat protein
MSLCKGLARDRGPALFLLAVLWGGVCDATPIANAGNNLVIAEGDHAVLDGSGSEDPRSPQLAYSWQQLAGPQVKLAVFTSSASFLAPEVNDNQPVVYAFELTVENQQKEHARDTVYVVVQNVNQAPSAVIQGETGVDRDDVLILDGASSTDPEHETLSYLWYQLSGPPVQLFNPLGEQSVFAIGTPPEGMIFPYRIEMALRVTDPLGGHSETALAIMVTDSADRSPEGRSASAQGIADFHLARRREKLKNMVANEELRIAVALSSGDWNAAMAHVGNALAIDPTDPTPVAAAAETTDGAFRQWTALLKKGHDAFRLKNYLAAIRAYRQAGNVFPDNSATPALLQVCVTALGEQSLLRSDPTSVQAANLSQSRTLYLAGLQHYSAGHLKSAADMWKRAVSLDPQNRLASTAYNRAAAELKQ